MRFAIAFVGAVMASFAAVCLAAVLLNKDQEQLYNKCISENTQNMQKFAESSEEMPKFTDALMKVINNKPLKDVPFFAYRHLETPKECAAYVAQYKTLKSCPGLSGLGRNIIMYLIRDRINDPGYKYYATAEVCHQRENALRSLSLE